jgi:hypothetical protein
MKNKTTQGLSNKNVLSFPKHDSLKYWRLKSNVNSHMSIQYVNQSESLSWSFSDLSGGKWCLQRKYMCRQHETLDCRKLHKQLSNSWHRYPFVTCLTRSGYIFFNWYLRLGENFFDIVMGWISKIFTKQNMSLRRHPPPPEKIITVP